MRFQKPFRFRGDLPMQTPFGQGVIRDSGAQTHAQGSLRQKQGSSRAQRRYGRRRPSRQELETAHGPMLTTFPEFHSMIFLSAL
jgi:hypothetical protein